MNLLPETLTFWHWWVLAVLLIILELTMPLLFFLWLGFAAALVGGGLYFFPEMGWKYQFLWFSVLSVLSVVISRMVIKRHPTHTDQPTLNRRGSQYIGRVITLKEPIYDGVGRINVDDTTWKVSGPDLPAGRKIRIVASEGTLLKTEEVVEEGV